MLFSGLFWHWEAKGQYLLAQHTPDLILLDLMLPGCTGEELLPRLQGIPVIVAQCQSGVWRQSPGPSGWGGGL